MSGWMDLVEKMNWMWDWIWLSMYFSLFLSFYFLTKKYETI